MVARGQSYRRTAATIRQVAGRPLDDSARRSSSGQVLEPAQQHGQLVSDWVEVFGPVIWAAYAPARWPQWLLVDDTSFRVSGAARPGRRRGEEAFSVLGAVGYGPHQRPELVAVEAVPVVDAAAWQVFLRSLKGTPSWSSVTAGCRSWPRTGCSPADIRRRSCGAPGIKSRQKGGHGWVRVETRSGKLPGPACSR